MDVQEPEDQLEREAEAETLEEELTPSEVASSADPSSDSEPTRELEEEPEASIPTERPAEEPAPEPKAEGTVDKQDVQRMEDEGGFAAEPLAEVLPESLPDAEPEDELEVPLSSEAQASESTLEMQESVDQIEDDQADEEELTDQPAAHVEVAPISDPEPAPRAEATIGTDGVSIDGSVEGPAWYVVHCYSGYENKVRHNLEQRIETMGMKDRIFDVVIPTQEEIEVKDGKRRTVERHIFPGYVLVNMALSEESWYVVRNTPGVTGFVGMGNQPTPLRPEEVSQIIKRMEAEAPTVKVTYKVGERVRIVDGPFNDFRGVVAEIDMERTKVRVMVSFFGRETPVELDFLQVEKA
jgi:transcription termination/antitermination protein NusG